MLKNSAKIKKYRVSVVHLLVKNLDVRSMSDKTHITTTLMVCLLQQVRTDTRGR